MTTPDPIDQWKKSAAKIATLSASIQTACKDHITRCALEGIFVVVTEAVRSSAYQATLYGKGRDASGKIVNKGAVVTYAPAGYSVHEYMLAYDLAIDGVTTDEYGLTPQQSLIDGKVCWPNPMGKALELWKSIVRCGKAVGMKPGAEFLDSHGAPFPDWPHFQFTGGLTINDLRAGKRPTGTPDQATP